MSTTNNYKNHSLVEKENFSAKATYKSLGMCECNYHMYEYERRERL